jgi:hypothetical protein
LFPRFAVTATRGGPPYELHGEPDCVDLERDLAAYFLPDDYPEEGIGFWPGERMDVSEEKLSTDFLFVHGFPAVRSGFSVLAGGLMNRSFPYGVMRCEEGLPDSVASFQFAMDPVAVAECVIEIIKAMSSPSSVPVTSACAPS